MTFVQRSAAAGMHRRIDPFKASWGFLGRHQAKAVYDLREGESRRAPACSGVATLERIRGSAWRGLKGPAEAIENYHFSRAFKQIFGIPPHRFHLHCRIERAKSLLRSPAASITSVGMAVGFSEASAFSTAFRKATGMTPTGFQRSA